MAARAVAGAVARFSASMRTGIHCGRAEISGGVEAQRAVRIETEYAIGDAAVQMRVSIERFSLPPRNYGEDIESSDRNDVTF
jgi:hypothetical protein